MNREMPEAPDGGWGWVIVAAATISNLSLLPIQQCFGLIFEREFSKLGITATQTSFILHLNATIMCSLGMINGPLMKKFSFRTVACMGTTFIFFGICLAAFAKSLQVIIIAYCVFIAIGQGMMYPAIGLALNTYFCKKRSVAMGLTITLTGLGPIVMPQLIAKLLESYETNGTLLILAAIALHSFIGACLLRPFVAVNKISDVKKRTNYVKCNKEPSKETTGDNFAEEDKNRVINHPEEIKLLDVPQDEIKNSIEKTGQPSCENEKPPETPTIEENLHAFSVLRKSSEKIKAKNFFSKISESLDLDLLKDNHFLIIILGMGITLVSELNFATMTPFVLSELAGLTPTEIATVMSVQASADITGRLCVPLLAQKFGWSSKFLYGASLLGSILGRSILATWCSSYVIIILVSLLLGVAKGTKAVFQALVIPDNVTLIKLPAASGLLMVFNGILSILLGPLIGLVHDKTHSYVGALHFTSVLSFSCVIFWVGEYYYNKRMKRRGREGDEEETKNCEET